MIVRNCAGGIVFCGDKVLMLLNDKHEWAFPKGVVRAGQKLTDIAVKRIKIEAGVDASIVAPCGKTKYEFFSVTRRMLWMTVEWSLPPTHLPMRDAGIRMCLSARYIIT